MLCFGLIGHDVVAQGPFLPCFSLLLAEQPSFLPVLFHFAMSAFGAGIGKITACYSPDKNSTTRRTFISLVNTVFAAFFASQRLNHPFISITFETLLHRCEEFLFTHLVFGFAARIGAFDPGHLIVRNGVDAASPAATPGKGYQASYSYKDNDNTDHNTFFLAVFHT
jgi:hypothetical protein